jgi:divalent metal cation (Fe/Co/Zn/Cd) transporter
MGLNKTKWFTFAVAICFAILQALQPFIHAHVDTEHPIQNLGFHVGHEHEEAISMQSLADHTLSNIPHASHTVLVASGIKQDSDSMNLLKALVAIVFSFCFILVLQSTHKLNSSFLFVAKESLKRRLPASRAPPQF